MFVYLIYQVTKTSKAGNLPSVALHPTALRSVPDKPAGGNQLGSCDAGLGVSDV